MWHRHIWDFSQRNLVLQSFNICSAILCSEIFSIHAHFVVLDWANNTSKTTFAGAVWIPRNIFAIDNANASKKFRLFCDIGLSAPTLLLELLLLLLLFPFDSYQLIMAFLIVSGSSNWNEGMSNSNACVVIVTGICGSSSLVPHNPCNAGSISTLAQYEQTSFCVFSCRVRFPSSSPHNRSYRCVCEKKTALPQFPNGKIGCEIL